MDTWLANPKIPADLKDTVPTDADLILVSHGHFDHSGSAPDLLKASVKPNAQILAIYEIADFFVKKREVPEAKIGRYNIGGTKELDFCSVTLVHADHSSGCPGDDHLIEGGASAGYVISTPVGIFYHAGDTGVFGDMAIISELYKPDFLMLPIGGNFTMGPREAAYAVAKLLLSGKIVIPMHFGTFPLLTGNVADFEKFLAQFSDEFKREAVKVVDPHIMLEAPVAIRDL